MLDYCARFRQSLLGGWRLRRAPFGRFVVPAVVAVGSLAVALSPALAIDLVVHRGANEVAPENTQAAAQQCIDWGVAYVEIDIRTSKDKVLYVLHDPLVNRTTNGKGFLRQLTSAEIDKLDAGSWFDPKFAGQRVPKLRPYLEWIKGKAKVYFDVKDADLKQLIAMVYDVGMENDCFFWFSSSAQAEKFRELDQKLALKVNVRSPKDVAEAVGRFRANIVEVGLDNMSPELVKACKERKLQVMIYHPQKDAKGFAKVIEWEPDLVNLNHPDLFQQVEREAAALKALK